MKFDNLDVKKIPVFTWLLPRQNFFRPANRKKDSFRGSFGGDVMVGLDELNQMIQFLFMMAFIWLGTTWKQDFR